MKSSWRICWYRRVPNPNQILHKTLIRCKSSRRWVRRHQIWSRVKSGISNNWQMPTIEQHGSGRAFSVSSFRELHGAYNLPEANFQHEVQNSNMCETPSFLLSTACWVHGFWVPLCAIPPSHTLYRPAHCIYKGIRDKSKCLPRWSHLCQEDSSTHSVLP